MYSAKLKKVLIALFAIASLAFCGAAFAEDEEEFEVADPFGRKFIAEDIEASDMAAMAKIIADLGLKWDPNRPETWPMIEYSEEGYEGGGCVDVAWYTDGGQHRIAHLRFHEGDGASGVLDVSGLSALKTLIVDPDAGITEVIVADWQEIEHIEAPGRDKYHEGDLAALKALLEPLGKDNDGWEGYLGESPADWSYRRLGNDATHGFVRWSTAMPMRVEGLRVYEMLKRSPEERWPKQLDLTKFGALKYVDGLAGSRVKAVDVSNCTALEEIDAVYASDLEELKIKGCESLRKVNCYESKIGDLDMSGAPNIELYVASTGIAIPAGMKGMASDKYDIAKTIADRVVLVAQLVDPGGERDDLMEMSDEAISKMLAGRPELVAFTAGLARLTKEADPARYDRAVKEWQEREGMDGAEFGGSISGVTKRVAARAAEMIFGRKVAITGIDDDAFILVDGLGDPGWEARVEGLEDRGDGTSVISGSIIDMQGDVTGTFEITLRESEDAYRGVEVVGCKRAMG